MSRILLAAHDRGGANLLLQVFYKVIDKQHDVRFYKAGPASNVESKNSFDITEKKEIVDKIFNDFHPNLVITGTSKYSNFENLFWRRAGELDIPSIALVDAWINIKDRLIKKNTKILSQPTILGVIDSSTKDQVEKESWCKSKVLVTGQPHLESIMELSKKNSRKEKNNTCEILYVSEPIKEQGLTSDFRFDQYDILDILLKNIPNDRDYKIIIKPHPNELKLNWEKHKDLISNKNNFNIVISNQDIDNLILNANLIAGFASMSLIEAAILEKSVLSIQFGNNINPNPIFKKISNIKLVKDTKMLAPMLKILLDNSYRCSVDKEFMNYFTDSNKKIFDIIANEFDIL